MRITRNCHTGKWSQQARKLALISVFFSSLAWTRPKPPTTFKAVTNFQERLNAIVVLVNGQARTVKADEELAVVRGDTVVLTEAHLVNQNTPREVNVLGFSHAGGKPNDDIGFAFKTTDLKTRYSEEGKGEVYAILATTGQSLNGKAYLRVIEPTLRYAEITINGSPRILRDGEPLKVKATDQFQVARVVTNLDSTDGVRFQIEPELDDRNAAKPGSYTIRFTRAGQSFADIPLRVDE